MIEKDTSDILTARKNQVGSKRILRPPRELIKIKKILTFN